MATIIDATYFERGSTYIPNNKDLSVEPTDTPSSKTELEFFIEEYERSLLLNALGAKLYTQLVSALADLPNADAKWQKLVEGDTYDDANGKTKIWRGLNGGDNKQSVIAFYVFTEYLRNDNETYAIPGTVQSDSQNATRVPPTAKFVKAYNQFIKAYQGEFFYGFPTVVKNQFGSIGYDWYGEETQDVSLFRYLNDQNDLDETSFPDFQFKFYESQNSFGI